MNSEKKENNATNEIAQKAYRLGYLYEKKYGACSQCAILAIMDALSKRNEDLFKAAFGFAGGVGNMSKMCGALAAGTMMISLEYGRELNNLATQMEEEKRECLRKVRDLLDRFVEEYESIECANVHNKLFGRTFNQWNEEEFQEFLRLGGHEDKCTSVVGNVAKWTVEILTDNQ
ncbi:MAG: C-GCAxxG-C-C family protein [Anaerolineales bacterium]